MFNCPMFDMLAMLRWFMLSCGLLLLPLLFACMEGFAAWMFVPILFDGCRELNIGLSPLLFAETVPEVPGVGAVVVVAVLLSVGNCRACRWKWVKSEVAAKDIEDRGINGGVYSGAEKTMSRWLCMYKYICT